jgi:hypothetical protein
MADIQIYPYRSPRIIEVLDPDVEIDLQELHNLIRDWEDGEDGHTFDYLIDSAGKEPLGGGVSVGITSTLQDAYVMFTGRTTPIETGICSSGDPDGTTLNAAYGQFVTNNVAVGDTVMNYTTKALATVINVVSDVELETLQLSGGSRSTWLDSDEYIVWNNEQCNISGGNLVAVDSGGSEMSPVLPSPNVQVVRTASSSATLQELAAIEYASFNGGVTIDTTSSYTGTVFPVGTPQQPVNNLADAMSIAFARGLTTICVLGDLTIDGGADYTQMNFVGESINKSTLTITSDAIVPECEFYEATITGTLDGNAKLERCRVLNLDYVYGVIEQCLIGPGTVVLGGSNEVHLLNCRSGVAGSGTPVIDCGGSGQDLGIRNYSGGIKLINKSGVDKVSIDLNSGQVVLDSTVTDGEIVVRGVGNLTDNSTGSAVVNTYGLMSKKTITEITWDTVHIDTVNGIAGTDWPIGTRSTPSDNITDAKTIAAANNICCYKLTGNITLNSDFSSTVFKSDSSELATINLGNQNVAKATFQHIGLTGQCNGSIHVYDCELDAIQNIEGVFMDCALSGAFSVKSGGKAYFFGSFSHDLSPMSFDMSGDGTLVYYGTAWITVTNLTSAAGPCAFSGDIGITVDSSVTDGYIYITGDTVVDADNKTGGAVVTAYKNSSKIWEELRAGHVNAGTFGAVGEWAGNVDESAIADAVWDEALDGHLTPGTTGKKLNDGGTGDPDTIAAAVWDALQNDYGTPGTMGWLQGLLESGIISKPRIIPGD